jgi:hypothetical protein
MGILHKAGYRFTPTDRTLVEDPDVSEDFKKLLKIEYSKFRENIEPYLKLMEGGKISDVGEVVFPPVTSDMGFTSGGQTFEAQVIQPVMGKMDEPTKKLDDKNIEDINIMETFSSKAQVNQAIKLATGSNDITEELLKAMIKFGANGVNYKKVLRLFEVAGRTKVSRVGDLEKFFVDWYKGKESDIRENDDEDEDEEVETEPPTEQQTPTETPEETPTEPLEVLTDTIKNLINVISVDTSQLTNKVGGPNAEIQDAADEFEVFGEYSQSNSSSKEMIEELKQPEEVVKKSEIQSKLYDFIPTSLWRTDDSTFNEDILLKNKIRFLNPLNNGTGSIRKKMKPSGKIPMPYQRNVLSNTRLYQNRDQAPVYEWSKYTGFNQLQSSKDRYFDPLRSGFERYVPSGLIYQ